MRNFLLTLGLLSLVGCHNCGHHGIGNDGDLVGGSCHDDHDCEDECLKGADFPDGTCSLPCDDHHDCPDGTVCIDKSGGSCLLLCDHDADCRGGYSCKDENNRGEGGKSAVCIE